jgi:hypothetical protein
VPKDNSAPEPQFQVVPAGRPSAAAVKFFRIRDFGKYQHYKDRNPPWVKLYGELLEDYEFQQLPISARYLYIHLTWLASKTGNKIPNDPAWVAGRINAEGPVDLDLLFREGWLEAWRPRPEESYVAGEQLSLPEGAPPTPSANSAESAASADDSKLLASCYQVASTETETETETHTEADTEPASAGVGRKCVCCGSNVFSRFSYQEALDLVRRWKAEGRRVGGRPIENVGGLARTLHQEGTADAEIAEMLRPPPPKREFTTEPCPRCFGTKMEVVPGKGARDCPGCLDELGHRTGLKPKEGNLDGRADDG